MIFDHGRLLKQVGALAMLCTLAACGTKQSPQVATPPAGSPSDTREEGWEPAPIRIRSEIELQTFALICPQGARLLGTLPPGGTKAWCVGADGERHGPSAEWTESGELRRITMFAKNGSIEWTLECEPSTDGTVVGSLRSGDGKTTESLEARRCEDLSKDLLGH